MIDSSIIKAAKEHIALSSRTKDTDYFCSSRDVFQARLDSFIQKSQKYLESALIGEVGNNTFDHNWQYSEGQMRGAYFNLNFMDKYVILARFVTERLNFCKRTIFGLVVLRFLTLNWRSRLWF